MDMEARAIKDYPENVFSAKRGIQTLKLLKSIAIVGNTSSGKSNWFKGFDLMRYMVLNSTHETWPNKNRVIEPFRLSTENENQPTQFECTILIKNVVYRYGFKCNNIEITAEWLHMQVKRREETIFSRTRDEYSLLKRFPTDLKNKLAMLSGCTRKDALFLSVLSKFNVEIASQILQWFQKNMVYSDADLVSAINYTVGLLAKPQYSALIHDIIKRADQGFTFIDKQINVYSNGSLLKTNHCRYDAGNKLVDEVYMDLFESESTGAQKLIALIGPMVKILADGGIYWVDDLDSKINPQMIALVLDLFHSEKHNKNNAQLVLASYNQQISKQLRRDQVVNVIKNSLGESVLSTRLVYKAQVRDMGSIKTGVFQQRHSTGNKPGIPAGQLTNHINKKRSSKANNG